MTTRCTVFTSLLADLATICTNTIQPSDDMPTFTIVTTPTPCSGKPSTYWPFPPAKAWRSQHTITKSQVNPINRPESGELRAIQLDSQPCTGAVLPTLIDLSKEADMVVVGCRGVGAIARRMLGSVSWGLAREAHCPAVIYDEDPLMPYPVAQAPVVVGIDGSPASESATAIAFNEASRRGVELVAVHAWSDFAVDELPGVE